MNVTEINTHYGWYNNQLQVTEYRTQHFEKGNDVRTTVQRLYHVTLYNARGQVEETRPKGSNVDMAT